MTIDHPYRGASLAGLLVWRAGPARAAAAQVLQDLGIASLDMVETAVDAFALLAKSSPRIILVDADLRPTSGLVFLRELRATTVPSRDAPAVMVSARPNDALNADARRAGADGVMFGRVTAAGLQFWLSCTEPDVRVIIECKGYRGPDRRMAGAASAPPAAERRKAGSEANTGEPITARIAEARRQVELWSDAGDPAPLASAVAALLEAGALARARAEPALVRGVDAALLRLQSEAESWDVDPAGLVGALIALQGLSARSLGPGPSTGAMETPP